MPSVPSTPSTAVSLLLIPSPLVVTPRIHTREATSVPSPRYFPSPTEHIILQPWYLTTIAVAEQLYDALIVWNAQGSLEVTSTSLAFFRQFSSTVAVGTYASSTATFTTLTSAVKTWADGFIAVHAKYTPSNGGLAEQYSRSNGNPVSAVDLTWSYAAVLTALAARDGKAGPSWGAAGLTVPATCSTAGTGSGGGGSSGGPTVAVTFNNVATTTFGGTWVDMHISSQSD